MIKYPVRIEHIKKCYDFSKSIIENGNQYNRFQKSAEMQIERTFVGMLGEYIFLLYLRSMRIPYPLTEMFRIYQGTSNVDSYDFVTDTKETIDIKVASKSYHRRIMVPVDQFKLKKDFYVGIKINFKLGANKAIDIRSANTAYIYGYATRETLENTEVANFGEGLCRHYPLEKLQSIDKLLDKFNKNIYNTQTSFL